MSHISYHIPHAFRRKSTDISEEHDASIFKAKSTAINQNEAGCEHSKYENGAVYSSEKSTDFQRAIWRYIPDDTFFISTSVSTSNP
jgi:hypothetical protein